MTVTIFMPISRDTYLESVFSALEMMECDREQTNILTLVDGDAKLFVRARNFTESSKFGQRLCVQRKPDGKFRSHDILRRRERIADIHNEAKAYLQTCAYVFLVEDDTVVPRHALQNLLRAYAIYPYAGFVQGVELGRWGIPYVGAWCADDVYEPTRLETLLPPAMEVKDIAGRFLGTAPTSSLDEIDAGGLYCVLTKWEHYKAHQFSVFGNNDLGPDIDYGLTLRRQGFKNYIDWSITCGHRVGSGESIGLSNTTPKQVMMIKEGDNWRLQVGA